MGKLGKKARKFAKKHLQSVLRRRRKTKALFKKKASKAGKDDIEEEQVDNPFGLSNGRRTESEGIENISLDMVFTENDKDEVADASDSDGYLSETGKTLEDEIASSTYSAQNEKIHADLAIQKKKLDRLRKKDPEFRKFLESFKTSAETFQSADGQDSDEGDTSDQEEPSEDGVAKDKGKILTSRAINRWCEMFREDKSQSTLISLLNAYRSACHYGTESIGHQIENSETFCNIVLFTLSNGDDIFRGLFHISSSNSTKEITLELKKMSKWKSLKPLVKSFVRSTLFLLNQVTDTEILSFAMTRIRASLLFFLAFPSLIQRLIKLPKHYLKSRSFQEECFLSAIEQLSLHFAQWCYHISFPDLATIPLIRLRKIHEITTIESLRRMVKRLIDQVEQNVDFVQKKRDEVSFSPHDHQSVDSFLQFEKSSLNATFTQYYRCVLDKAAERNLHKSEKISLPEQRIMKRNRAEPKRKTVGTGLCVDGEHDPAIENGGKRTLEVSMSIA
ncbi:hypothetical protein CDL12_18781 [Handroanthus impetiginosus]|uniref:Nucleolar complex protein 2 n=1 Tax=Handroanthus impetiginosus TaxID=429701 RepID=A0A2G9GTP7_9LAMI|nr:hypothetical protein CDL12_18781 [Handroanthus impetiginosus]